MSILLDESSGSKGVDLRVVATSVGMSMFGHLVWPNPFYEFGKAEDWA